MTTCVCVRKCVCVYVCVCVTWCAHFLRVCVIQLNDHLRPRKATSIVVCVAIWWLQPPRNHINGMVLGGKVNVCVCACVY